MSDYEKARAELLEKLIQFRDTFALGYDVSQETRRLIQELQAEIDE